MDSDDGKALNDFLSSLMSTARPRHAAWICERVTQFINSAESKCSAKILADIISELRHMIFSSKQLSLSGQVRLVMNCTQSVNLQKIKDGKIVPSIINSHLANYVDGSVWLVNYKGKLIAMKKTGGGSDPRQKAA